MRAVSLSVVFAFLVDQASKYAAIHILGVSALNSIEVFPPYLRFIYGENRGINFGLLADGTSRWLLISLAVLICIGVFYWLRRAAQPLSVHVCAGFLIGGALGNVFDRVVYGYVIDFINNDCCGIGNPFVYNLADVFIFVGALGLVFLAKEDKTAKKGA